MEILKKILNLLNKNIYTFLFGILMFLIFIYSVFAILDMQNINPFLYFQF